MRFKTEKTLNRHLSKNPLREKGVGDEGSFFSPRPEKCRLAKGFGEGDVNTIPHPVRTPLPSACVGEGATKRSKEDIQVPQPPATPKIR